MSVNTAESENAQPVAHKPASELIYRLEDRPPLPQTLFAAFQHLLAMFVAVITPALLICQALGLPAQDTQHIISMSLFASGVASIIQIKAWGPVGSGLLSIQGTSFNFVAPLIMGGTALKTGGADVPTMMAALFGTLMLASCTEMVLSRILHLARRIITPLVSGVVVMIIGLSLIQVGLTSIGGGYAAMADHTFGAPKNLLLAGIFIAACFISLSIGTSVGTIVALTPVAVGLAEKTGIDLPYMTAIVVGGSFFGDNLSFISDTTIAATRTQGCAMRDKFRANIKVALPAALLALACYILLGWNVQSPSTADISIEWMKVFPYLLVLVTALAGIHVMAVLTMGLLATGLIGIGMGYFSFMAWFQAMGSGMTGMGELIIVTLLAGGVLSIIRFNGGIAYIIGKITAHIHSRRGAEFSIAGLVSLANLCTANNTIALIMAGPIAKDIADRFKIDPRRSASLLDIFSCFVQGIIPYGAQMLMAAGLGHLR